MYSLLKEKIDRTIHIGLIGTGFIGSGILSQAKRLKQFNPMVVYYHKTVPHIGKQCKTKNEVRAAIKEGKTAVINDIDLLFGAPVDIVVDATGDVDFGLEVAYKSIRHGIPIMASPEVDATVGGELNRFAKKNNVLYSGFAGDEPGEIVNLKSSVDLMGFEIIGAGKFKQYHNVYANPTTVKKWADMYKQNPYMIASFADGTKNNIEMAVVSNATGLVPDRTGMHLPEGTLETVSSLIRPVRDGGILHHRGVVDIIRGVEPSGGVFVVGYSNDERVRTDFQYLKMGDGPYYLFYKPYHLCHYEMMMGIAKVVIMKHPVMNPLEKRVSTVVPYAKKELNKGDIIDSMGGYSFYGLIKKAGKDDVPVGIIPNARVKKKIRKDDILNQENVELKGGNIEWDREY